MRPSCEAKGKAWPPLKLILVPARREVSVRVCLPIAAIAATSPPNAAPEAPPTPAPAPALEPSFTKTELQYL